MFLEWMNIAENATHNIHASAPYSGPNRVNTQCSVSVVIDIIVFVEGSLGKPNLQSGPFFLQVLVHLWLCTSSTVFLKIGSSGNSHVVYSSMRSGILSNLYCPPGSREFNRYPHSPMIP